MLGSSPSVRGERDVPMDVTIKQIYTDITTKILKVGDDKHSIYRDIPTQTLPVLGVPPPAPSTGSQNPLHSLYLIFNGCLAILQTIPVQ